MFVRIPTLTGLPELHPLTRARLARGMTRAKLAILAEVSPGTLWLAETGRWMSDTTAAKVAAALGVDPTEIKPTK